jgi:hypothetical protein
MLEQHSQGFLLTRHWRDTAAGTEVDFWLATEAVPRRVRVGASDADNTEIVAGPLRVGDVIITGSNTTAKKAGGLFSGPPGGRRESANGGKGDNKAGTAPPRERPAE